MMERTVDASHRWFGLGAVALGLGLVLNTLLGPLFADVIGYPFSETVRNETLGLEAITLVLVGPLAIIAGALALRGHPAAGVVALGPAGYSAYMFVQYIVGPQYLVYEPVILFHLALFVLSGALLIRAWNLIDIDQLPSSSRGWAVVVLLLGVFALSRWTGVFADIVSGEPVPAAATDATMFWSIYLLDLGFIVPITIATGVGLLVRQPWATKALYGVVGWFALVPPSVAAMAIVKVVRDDPIADAADTVVILTVSLIFAAVAIWLYAPLFRRGDAARASQADEKLAVGHAAPGH